MTSKPLLFVFLAVLFSTCTDLDTEHPFDITQNDYFQSQEDYIKFIGRAYTYLRPFAEIGGIYDLQEVSSDEMCVPTRGREWDEGGRWRRMHRHTWEAADQSISIAWNSLYQGINESNRLIKALRDLDQAMAGPFIAEMRGLRAFFYLWLLDLYGNIPIVTEFEFESTSTAMAQTVARTEVFQFVESEIKAALQEVETRVNSSTYGRIHFWVLKTMLAQLYINAEVYSGTQRWNEVIEICEEIENSGIYRLEDDFFDNFRSDNHNSTEFIFAIPIDQNANSISNLAMASLHYSNQQTYNLGFQPWNGWCSLEDFYKSFDDLDQRRGSGNFPGSFIYGVQFSAQGDTLYQDTSFLPAEPGDPDGLLINLTPSIASLDNALTQDGARIGKYQMIPGTNYGIEADIPLYRYAEVLLMKAEACWRTNREEEALILLNMIRARVGLPPLPTVSENELLAELGWEFFAEAKRRTQLIRFGKFNDEWWEKEASEQCKVIFPIPASMLEAGSNLNQNPCY